MNQTEEVLWNFEENQKHIEYFSKELEKVNNRILP